MGLQQDLRAFVTGSSDWASPSTTAGSNPALNSLRVEVPLSDSQIIVEKTPLGLRLTLLFLRLLALAMIVPLLGGCFVGFISMIAGASSVAPFPRSLLFSLLGLGAFLLSLTMLSGIAWLESHLSQSPVPFASSWVATRPGHPARQLILPAVASVAFYGYSALLMWILTHITPDRERTIGWPLTWGSVAIGATFLLRYLRTKLPG